ncbi:MAG: hypothetical protein AAGF95_31510 [Chloroflexota bacterium]
MRDDLLLRMIFCGAANPDDRETLIEHLQLRRAESLELLDYIATWIENGVSMINEYGIWGRRATALAKMQGEDTEQA